MSANLLELQEMLRNLDMGSVQRVAAGQSGKAAQLLGMDEIKRRGEQMQEAKANQAEQQMQQPPMVDQYLAMSQQVMGQPVAPPPMMPAPAQQGIGSMMPQQPSPRMPAPQMAAAPPRPQMNPMAPAQPPQQMPPQMMAGGGMVRKFANGGTTLGQFPSITPDSNYGGGTFGFNPVVREGSEAHEELKRQLEQIKEMERLGIPITPELRARKSELINMTPSVYLPGSPGRMSFGWMGELYRDLFVEGEGERKRRADLAAINEDRAKLGLPSMERPGVSDADEPSQTEALTVDLGTGRALVTPKAPEAAAQVNRNRREQQTRIREQLLSDVNQALAEAGPLPDPREQPYLKIGEEEPGMLDRFGKTVKSGKLNPLFDMMMRSGLGLAAGENIGEAGIAGLTQATELAQQRREDARAKAADKLQARLGESRIGVEKAQADYYKSRAANTGLTYEEARRMATSEFSDNTPVPIPGGKTMAFSLLPPEQQSSIIDQRARAIMSMATPMMGSRLGGGSLNTIDINELAGSR